MGLLTVLILSAALAISCFIVGNLPLSFSFSRSSIAKLSTLGVGLLLGAALGVIIPEGVEAIYESSPESSNPSHTIALTLLSGFTLMLLVEQVFIPSPSSSPSPEDGYALAPNSASFEGARSSSNLHARVDSNGAPISHGGVSRYASSGYRQARSVTFGLVIHSLADGLALGASSFSRSSTISQTPSSQHTSNVYPNHTLEARDGSHVDPTSSHGGGVIDHIQSANPLTLIVFMALVIHKIPTALALATSLLPLIPPRRIRLHIAIFSIATPIGALLSLMLLGIVSRGGGAGESQSGLWAGMALAFSGGTFLYVATVLQPVRADEGASHAHQNGHVHPGEDEVQSLGPKTRVLLIVLGMFLPVMVSSVIGHGHGHGHEPPHR